MLLAVVPAQAMAADDEGLGSYPPPVPAVQADLGAARLGQEQSGPDDRAIGYYTKTYGVDSVEAERRLALQGKTAGLDVSLRSALPNGFAINWFDNKSGRVIIGVKSASEASEALKVAAEHGLRPPDVETEQVGYDEVDLSAAHNALRALAGRELPEASFSVAITGDGLVLRADGIPAGLAESVQALEDHSHVPVTVDNRAIGELPSADACAMPYCSPHVGGAGYAGNNGVSCTNGFLAVAGGGYYFLTAGHCVTGPDRAAGVGEWWGTCQPGGANCNGVGGWWAHGFMQNGAEDMGVHQAGSSVAPAVWFGVYPGYVNWWNVGVTPVGGAANAGVGIVVCHQGISTGSSCGTVTAVGTTVAVVMPWSGIHYTLAGMTRVQGACGGSGDSGGPYAWASYPWAAGLHSASVGGGCNTTTYYAPIGTATSVLGVAVATA